MRLDLQRSPQLSNEPGAAELPQLRNVAPGAADMVLAGDARKGKCSQRAVIVALRYN